MIKDRPRRLDPIFPRAPIFFVTFCPRDRRRIDPLNQVKAAFVSYCERALQEHNVAIGGYVIMPDHVHFFVRGNPSFVLSTWVAGLKRAMSVAVFKDSQPARLPPQEEGFKEWQAVRLPLQRRSLWQPGFFDHVLRNDESYAQKWEYVRENPVRAGLAAQWRQWPYQGEITRIKRA